MPIYEFHCAACGHQFEDLILRQREIEDLVCPRCGAGQVQQQLSSFALAGSSSKAAGGSSGGGCGSGSFS